MRPFMVRFMLSQELLTMKKKFHEHIRSYVKRSYKHYKPIGITARAQRYLDIKSAPGVIFAANNPNFAEEFITAITQQRFWNRKI